MCDRIYVNRGEIEIETPRQFEAHFGFAPTISHFYSSIALDSCLCQIDIEKSLNGANIPFKRRFGDYYVGEGLDEIKD
jgi:hypothetical protein